MKHLIISIILFVGNYKLHAQRIVIHKDLPKTLAVNTTTKTASLSLYADKLNDIKDARQKTTEYLAVIEEIQHKTFDALTNVNTALKNGKTVISIFKRVEMVYANLQELSKLAVDKPYLAGMAMNQTRLFGLRLTGLLNDLQNVVLKSDKATLINPVRRTQMVNNIYGDVWALYGISRSLVNCFKAYNLQDAMNKVIPYRDWYQNDKAITNDILKKVKR